MSENPMEGIVGREVNAYALLTNWYQTDNNQLACPYMISGGMYSH